MNEIKITSSESFRFYSFLVHLQEDIPSDTY